MLKCFCWVFILSVATISPIFLDLYPFSTFPMFSDNTNSRLVVEIEDVQNQSLPLQDYGLLKMQFAFRGQRYGINLSKNYFEEHNTIEPELVREFLLENYPDNEYPITISYKTRGYDEATGCVCDLTPAVSFRIDGPASISAAGDALRNAKTYSNLER